MIEFERFILKNGLTVLIHYDSTTPFVVINTLYNVGAKDENPKQTGFAHLFEHLMFGGSINIPEYDIPLQNAGGENNAFTNNDFTNYYLTIPKTNLETGLWLESDRMLSLAFTQKSLEVQKKVVIEEFKQRYLNQPYGDVSHLIRNMAYTIHPYQWPTIGKDISHIEKATLNDVKQFFFNHYAPNNAILSLAGNITKDEVKPLIEKWFGNIPLRTIKKRSIPKEPIQTEKHILTVKRNVAASAIFKVFHMSDRHSRQYYTTDLISDILSSGKSSRLYQHLVKEKQLFTNINAYISGSIDPGLFTIEGILNENIKPEEAEKAIDMELQEISQGNFTEKELTKVKNKFEANYIFSNYDLEERALNLAYYELLGDANLINNEINKYCQVSKNDILDVAQKLFTPENASVLYYIAEK
ncbi:MAG TPA: insulinase family protein [Bacteroidales bacterium]|nr:insulinase family protein [Bacteroidales bacterium]